MITIRATFNVFGFQTRKYDFTPTLGVGLIFAGVFLLIQIGT